MENTTITQNQLSSCLEIYTHVYNRMQRNYPRLKVKMIYRVFEQEGKLKCFIGGITKRETAGMFVTFEVESAEETMEELLS